jgi:hypothetical protein
MPSMIYAKSFTGLAILILSKVPAVTMMQYINVKNYKPINHLKFALFNSVTGYSNYFAGFVQNNEKSIIFA